MNKLIFALSLFVCCTAISSGFRVIKETGHQSFIWPSKSGGGGSSSSDNNADNNADSYDDEGGEPTAASVTASSRLPETDVEVSTEQSKAATKQPAKTEESRELNINGPKSQESLSTAMVPDVDGHKEVASDDTNSLDKQHEEMKSSSSEIDAAASDVLNELREVPSRKGHPEASTMKPAEAKNSVSPKTQLGVQNDDDFAHSKHHTSGDSLKDHVEKRKILTGKEKSKDESSNRLSSKVEDKLQNNYGLKSSLGKKHHKNKGVNRIKHKEATDEKSKNAARENDSESSLKKTGLQNNDAAKKSSNMEADVSRSLNRYKSSKRKHMKSKESNSGNDTEVEGKTSNAKRPKGTKHGPTTTRDPRSTRSITTEKESATALIREISIPEGTVALKNATKEPSPKQSHKNSTTTVSNITKLSTQKNREGLLKTTSQPKQQNKKQPTTVGSSVKEIRTQKNRKGLQKSKPSQQPYKKQPTTAELSVKETSTKDNVGGMNKTTDEPPHRPPLTHHLNTKHQTKKIDPTSNSKKSTGSGTDSPWTVTAKSRNNPAFPLSSGDNEHSRSHGNRKLSKPPKPRKDKDETSKKKEKGLQKHKENRIQNKQDDAKKEQELLTELRHLNDKDSEKSSHFPLLFLVSILLVIALYVMYHNRQKIIAIVVEGRSPGGRQRPNTSHYTKLEDAMPSVRKIVA